MNKWPKSLSVLIFTYYTYIVDRSIFRIDDKFRIVCTAEPQSSKSSGQQYTNHWSNPEFVSMFLFHHVKSLSLGEEEQVLLNKVIKCLSIHLCAIK